MAAVGLSPQLQSHVTISLDSNLGHVDEDDGDIQDLGEDELGIYDDNAECADLTDSELEDFDGGNASVTPGLLGQEMPDIQEEEESDEGEVTAASRTLPMLNTGNNDNTQLSTQVHDGAADDTRNIDDSGERISGVTFSKDNLDLAEKPTSSSTLDLAYMAGLRGKTNTPASYVTTENTLAPDIRDLDSRDTSRPDVESRETMYKQAVNLMSMRCLSKQMEESPWMYPFGIPDPQFFYIEQDTPVPMPPLKAWRGYNGNIYFEPIKVSPLSDSSQHAPAPPGKLTGHKPSHIPIPISRHSNVASRTDGIDQQSASRNQISQTRTLSRHTGQSSTKASTTGNKLGSRQMSVLDKRTVLNRFNSRLHEDLTWIEGQENTGTLAISNARIRPPKNPKDEQKIERDRLYKGLVSHKANNLKQKSLPRFSVAGNRFVPPSNMSPLLRTQTQYTLSTTRVVNNSPDLFYDKLPPLEHLRAKLRYNSREDPYQKVASMGTRHTAMRDEFKPFVKYSPEVRAKYERQRGANLM